MRSSSNSKRMQLHSYLSLSLFTHANTMSSSPTQLIAFNNSTEEDNHPSPFQNLKPSILIIILILSITLVVSISLCLLLRLLNRHCLRLLSPPSHATTTITDSSSSNRLSGHRVSPENPTSSVLDSLPIFSFGSIKRRSTSSANTISTGDCAVCLSKFETEDLLRLLPLCCHAFHTHCIDTWLQSNQTCPLCRSPIQASESDLMKALSSTVDGGRADSFLLEIGSISRRQAAADTPEEQPRSRSSYSVGSFDYIVEEESEIAMSHTHRRSVSDKENGTPMTQPTQEHDLAAEVAAGRSWLKEYVDRLSVSLSSRAQSFRSSGRFFTGSSRRSEISSAGEYDMEACRVGEEIHELFRWFSEV